MRLVDTWTGAHWYLYRTLYGLRDVTIYQGYTVPRVFNTIYKYYMLFIQKSAY